MEEASGRKREVGAAINEKPEVSSDVGTVQYLDCGVDTGGSLL